MLHTKKPREQSGRDTFSRYKAQSKSAAIATLSILEDKAVDRVYCDLHDDFVIRKSDSGKISYIFYQVKTHSKGNHNWTLNELFGLASKKKTENQDHGKILDSFAGKLLLHTIIFDSHCNAVVFQTNIHHHDEVEKLLKDIASGDFSTKFGKMLLDDFNEIFKSELEKTLTEEEVKSCLQKFNTDTDVQYIKLGDHNFEPYAGDRIYEYSEIELSRSELKEILLKLLDLVDQKSCGIIKDWNQRSIEELAGISIEDLLSILSISKDAYQCLKDGEDPKAIKSASMIQRALQNAGANSDEVSYCSRCKVDWDFWKRQNRHIITEMDLMAITQQISNLAAQSAKGGPTIDLSELGPKIKALEADLKRKSILFDLTPDLILGGVFSDLVKERI